MFRKGGSHDASVAPFNDDNVGRDFDCAACPKAGNWTGPIAHDETRSSRKGLDVAAHTLWKTGPARNMEQLDPDSFGTAQEARSKRVLHGCGIRQVGGARPSGGCG